MHLLKVAELLKSEHNINLVLDDEIINSIARLGYDKVFGARQLDRVITDRIRGPLSSKILSGELTRGRQVKIRIEGDDLNVYDAS